MLGVAVSTVNRWEQGKHDPSPRQFPQLCRVLDVTTDGLVRLLANLPAVESAEEMPRLSPASVRSRRHNLLVGASDAIDALVLPHQVWMQRITAPGRQLRVGAADVLRLRSVVELLRSLDHQYGGGLIYSSVQDLADLAQSVDRWLCDDKLRGDVHGAVAELLVLAGWAAFDAGASAQARRHFRAAEVLADSPGDPALAAYVRYCQARQYQHERNNRAAIQVLSTANEYLDIHASSPTTTMLHATVAPSLAALGDKAGALVELDRARRAFDEIDHAQKPPWMAWLDEAELSAQYGRVYRDLARGDRKFADDAVAWTRRAVRGFETDKARSGTLNLIGLSGALFLAGEVSMATDIGQRLPDEADAVASQRIRDRIVRLPRDAAPYLGRSSVAELCDMLSRVPRWCDV